MKYLGTCLVILSLIPAKSFAVFTAAGSACSGSDTLTVHVTDDGNAPTAIIGEVYADGAYDTCCYATCAADPKPVTAVAGSANTYTFTVTITGADTCGRTVSGNNKIVQVSVVVLKQANVLETEDKYITVKCDFTNTATMTIVEDVLFSTKLTSINAVIHPPDMVLRKKGDAPIGSNSLTLGDPVFIKVTLPAAVTASFNTARVTSCTAEAANDNAKSISLTKANGCVETNGIFSSGFSGSGSAATFKAVSPEFAMFRFIGEDGVIFKCTIEYCTASASNCIGDQCNANARRRREAVGLPSTKPTLMRTAVYHVALARGKDDLIVDPGSMTMPSVPAQPSSPAGRFTPVPTMAWVGVVTIVCATIMLLTMALAYVLRAREETKNDAKNKMPY